MKLRITKRLLAFLVLVALSYGTVQAQNNNWRNKDYKLVKLNSNGHEKSDLKDLTNTLGYLQEVDFTSKDLRQELKKARMYPQDFSVSRRDTRSINKKSILERSWKDIDRNYPRRGTENFLNIYLGLNQFIENGKIPDSDDLYSLHPINSTYIAINFDNITKILGPLYLEWGVGISYQDFAFDNARVEIIKDDVAGSITFTEVPDITGRKSKLNMSHINLHFVPTLSFGRYNSFRVGFGVYGGYRISSNTKRKFDDLDGDKQKIKINDNWYVNPFKYGFRAQIGWNSFDLFFNYDITELFEESKTAPRLNPISFGVIF